MNTTCPLSWYRSWFLHGIYKSYGTWINKQKDLGMACHTFPLTKHKGKCHYPASVPSHLPVFKRWIMTGHHWILLREFLALLQIHTLTTHLPTYLPTHPPTHSLTYPLTHPPTQLTHPYTPPTHTPTHSPTHPPTHPLTHPLIHPFTHPPTHPLTHPCTQPLIHPPTHSPIH